jgi:hypothetical protein
MNVMTTFNSTPYLADMGSHFRSLVPPTSSGIPSCPFLAAEKEEVQSPLLDPNTPTRSSNVEHHPTQEEPDMKASNNFNAENAITLLVGPEQQKLIVHASYITRTSAFFATALKKEWAEGQTRTVELQEETPELMAHYLDWVYTSKLPTKDCSLFHPESAKITAHDLLAELYVLGERRLDSDFRNAITAELVRLRLILHGSPGCRTSQRVTSVNTIYQGTPAGSPARRLMVDLSLRFGCHQCFTGDLDKAFLVDLTHAFFVAAHLPKGVEGQRGLEPKAEEYRV